MKPPRNRTPSAIAASPGLPPSPRHRPRASSTPAPADLDPQRSRADFAAAMREDLRWLGITWQAELKQCDRLGLYRDAMQTLIAAGKVYLATAPHAMPDALPGRRTKTLTMSPSTAALAGLLHPGPWALKPCLKTTASAFPTMRTSASPTFTPAHNPSAPAVTPQPVLATSSSGARMDCRVTNLPAPWMTRRWESPKSSAAAIC